MEVVKNLDGGKMVAEVKGRLDTATAPDFEKELKESLDSVTELILDFSELEYVSSAGLRVILSMQKIMSKQGSMVIRGVNDVVMEIFEVTGFADILTIE